MKLKIVFREIDNWKWDYIQADFKHFFAEMKFQTLQFLEKLEKNKGLQARLVNRLKKIKGFGGQLLTLEIAMEGIASIDLGNVSYEEEGEKRIVIFEMNQFYFDIVDSIKATGGSLWGYALADKKTLLKDFAKAFRKNITHKFQIIELE